jgi:hypothetical protein
MKVMMPSGKNIYLDGAIGLAQKGGLLDDGMVRLIVDRSNLPDWLKRFQTNEGFSEFEKEFGVLIPAALREFWSCPELVCVWGPGVDAMEEPIVAQTADRNALISFDLHAHSGSKAMVRLDGSENPPVVLDYEPDKAVSQSFSSYIEQGITAMTIGPS